MLKLMKLWLLLRPIKLTSTLDLHNQELSRSTTHMKATLSRSMLTSSKSIVKAPKLQLLPLRHLQPLLLRPLPPRKHLPLQLLRRYAEDFIINYIFRRRSQLLKRLPKHPKLPLPSLPPLAKNPRASLVLAQRPAFL